MLDIKLIRSNPDIVRENLKKRGDEEKIVLFEKLLKIDESWRKDVTRLNELRKEKNKISLNISKIRKEGGDLSDLKRKSKELSIEIKELEKKIREEESERQKILMSLPNILHESVPFGESEEDNVVVRKWGEPKKFEFKPKDHQDIALNLDLIDLTRAAKVAGSRFYYLKNALVELNLALIRYGIEFLEKRGFQIFQTPYLLRKSVVESATTLDVFEESIYKVENEDLYLIPTAEHSLLGYHMNEIIEEKKLPLLYAGITPCFRKEAGAHGRDTKGIFRVHQFEKIEQFVFSKPEDSWKWHEKLLKNAEEFLQSLGIPYRVVNVCTADIGNVAAKKYDIEAWLPGQNKYREVVSCSNCTDYQARRANIRYRDRNNEIKYLHTLNSTLVATERTIIAIIENYQQSDGSILIPKVLRKYLNADKITKKGLE